MSTRFTNIRRSLCTERVRQASLKQTRRFAPTTTSFHPFAPRQLVKRLRSPFERVPIVHGDQQTPNDVRTSFQIPMNHRNIYFKKNHSSNTLHSIAKQPTRQRFLQIVKSPICIGLDVSFTCIFLYSSINDFFFWFLLIMCSRVFGFLSGCWRFFGFLSSTY